MDNPFRPIPDRSSVHDLTLRRRIGIALLLFLSSALLVAEELHYAFLPYTAPGVPGTPDSPTANIWTVSRKGIDDHVEVTFTAEIVFYLFGRVSYSYTGWGKYDHSGTLIQAQTTIETMGRRRTVTVDEEAIDAALSITEARPLTAEEALVLSLTFINPETVRRRLVPGGTVLFPRVDLVQGRLDAVPLTIGESDSALLQRSVLRAASPTMEFLFHPSTYNLLYAFTSDIGFGAELVFQERQFQK